MVTVQKDITKKESTAPEGVEHTRERKVYAPAVDIYEKGDNIMLIADLPGVDEKSVDITLEKNILSIRGYVAPVELNGHKLVYAEYGDGDYYRTFTLSNEINRDKIEAVVKNGVLMLTLPKAETAKTRKIAVTAAV
jgi:HSP20 family molecular chaperone IbpA